MKQLQLSTVAANSLLSTILLFGILVGTENGRGQVSEVRRIEIREDGRTVNLVGLELDQDGNLIVGGWIAADRGNPGQIFLHAYQSDSTTVWTSQHDMTGDGEVELRHMQIDGKGRINLVGTAEFGPTGRDLLFLQYADNGSLNQVDQFDDDQNEEGVDLLFQESGRIVLLGRSIDDQRHSRLLLIEYEPDGSRGWVQRTDLGSHEDLYPVAITDGIDGEVLVTATAIDSAGGTSQVVILFDEKGEVKKVSRSDSDGHYAVAVAPDNDGWIGVAGIVANQNGSNIAISLHDPDGANLVSLIDDEAPGIYRTVDVATDGADGWLALCERATGQEQREVFPVHFNREGTSTRFESLSIQDMLVRSTRLVVGQSGTVYALGSAEGSDIPSDLMIASWNEDGELLWSSTADGGENRADRPIDMLIDSHLDVLAAATIDRPGEGQSGIIFRYRQVPSSLPAPVTGSMPALTFDNVSPNPFTSTTTLHYQLQRNSEVLIDVVDNRGNVVAVLFEEEAEAGEHQLVWEPQDDVPAGGYYCRLRVGDVLQVRACIYLGQRGGE